jgi:hypothetical protein
MATMGQIVTDDAHDLKSSKLFQTLIDEVGMHIPQSVKDGYNNAIGAGEIDTAIAGLLDLSGTMHWFAIPDSLFGKIQDWLDDFGTPEDDDYDYEWSAAKGAIEYSRSQINTNLALA